MNAGNVKPRAAAEINLEEFERRLRASLAPQAGIEDPLAELTRLVDTIGFDRAPERPLDPARPPRAARPEPRPDMPAPLNAAPEPAEPPAVEAVAHEAAPEPAPHAEPPLRPTLQTDAPPPPPEEEPWVAPIPTINANVAPPPTRSNNWGLKVGGLIAAAAVMVGAVVVFKIGGGSHSGAPPLILASTAPTKVPPPSADTVRTANESGALLTRDTAQPTVTPPKLVNAPEAPVDLASRPTASPAPGATPSASASDSPVAPSSNTPIVATATPGATQDSPVGDDPNRVKTISVRPDGSLISSGYEANAAAAPAPTPAPTAPVTADADAQPSSPGVALPTKLSPPKSGTRVVTKGDTTAPADAGDGPAPVAPKSKKPKAKPAAEAQDALKSDDAKPADDAAAPEAASGGFAVQLAAPRSEAEAKALIKRLSTKYADALGATALGVRKADRKGETIYRVRAGGLSRDDAKAMCVKIKSAGGDCYIAKN